MFYFFIFIFGLCVGSFLNVLILRLGSGQVFRLGSDSGEAPHQNLGKHGTGFRIGGRSHCPKCAHQLGWKDLMPVLSFIWLKGKCRYCGEKISWQYPIVEAATGILFVFLFLSIFNFNLSISDVINLIYLLFITSCLIVIFVSDLKYFIIPDEIILTGIIGFFVFKLFGILNLGFFSDLGLAPLDSLASNGVKILDFKILLNPLLSAIAASAFFLAIVLVTRGKGMGLGDVKFAFLMGLVLGWPQILGALLLAFVSGALVGLGLILAGRAKMKSEIPFGTFLAANTFLIMLLSEKILIRYINLII